MARRTRDYAAEQRRRNELARQRGFTSRSQQRRAIERGKIAPIRPKLIRSPRTVAAQEARRERVRAAELMTTQAVENESWSRAHAVRQIGRFDPRTQEYGGNRLPQYTVAEYTEAYNRAFVNGPLKYKRRRNRGGSPALRRYFVDLTGHFTTDEYEARYGHTR